MGVRVFVCWDFEGVEWCWEEEDLLAADTGWKLFVLNVWNSFWRIGELLADFALVPRLMVVACDDFAIIDHQRVVRIFAFATSRMLVAPDFS